LPPELKALGAASVAGIGVVGVAFGASAIVRRIAPPTPVASDSRNAGMPGMSMDVHAAGGPSKTAATVDVGAGKKLFAANCVSCHGENGAGGFGPKLIGTALPADKITKTVENGVSGKMPAYKAKLSAADIAGLVAYVRSLK
jgi:mono/diheme cytochrome c family protein